MMRLDLYLVQAGKAPSRSRAQKMIEDGNVTVDGKCIQKPSFLLSESEEHLIVALDSQKYVSRGGYKLEGALQDFSITPKGYDCADIGASTGGFTDCLLQNGARQVYAIDVGSGQMDTKLLLDKRVHNIEKVNARYSLKDKISCPMDLVVSDVSFISQTYIIPNIQELLKEDGFYLFLVKPQFECGPKALNKNGIVTDCRFHISAIQTILRTLLVNNLSPLKIAQSHILGGDGNREYLVLSQNKSECQSLISEERIRQIVYE